MKAISNDMAEIGEGNESLKGVQKILEPLQRMELPEYKEIRKDSDKEVRGSTEVNTYSFGFLFSGLWSRIWKEYRLQFSRI